MMNRYESNSHPRVVMGKQYVRIVNILFHSCINHAFIKDYFSLTYFSRKKIGAQFFFYHNGFFYGFDLIEEVV